MKKPFNELFDEFVAKGGHIHGSVERGMIVTIHGEKPIQVVQPASKEVMDMLKNEWNSRNLPKVICLPYVE
jgi:(p)ppGpp synthase/HD superfamily hydrolase